MKPKFLNIFGAAKRNTPEDAKSLENHPLSSLHFADERTPEEIAEDNEILRKWHEEYSSQYLPLIESHGGITTETYNMETHTMCYYYQDGSAVVDIPKEVIKGYRMDRAQRI